MENKRRIYLLDPQKYSPETIAVAFAKTSRSPESFIEIAAELNETKSADFNEKWVVGYGHSSVAEHAVLHIAVENISRLACECLESNRLASYTEKSTRYQTWNADAFYTPEELMDSPLLTEYLATIHLLLSTYQSIIPLVIEQFSRECPRLPEETENGWQRRIRSQAIDNCRFLLPSAVLANVGVTINARALEHALVKMLSAPLAEARRIGAEIKAAAVEAVPTLLKYANADDSLIKATSALAIPNLPAPAANHDWCQLIDPAEGSENKILAAYLYRLSGINYTQCMDWVQSASSAEKKLVTQSLLTQENPHSIPLREMEHSSFTFDITLDQGAYYEVKRHRMMTLTPQELTANLGFALPRAIVNAGQEQAYCAAMQQARTTYNKLAGEFPHAAAYIVPNAFNRRFLITSNYRSLVHFINLRSAANAHFSVRRLAQSMSQELQQALPVFSQFFPANPSESVQSIESTYFIDTMREDYVDQ